MVSSFQRIVTVLYSFIPCFLKAISISSGVASDSSLLLTMLLQVFNLAWIDTTFDIMKFLHFQ